MSPYSIVNKADMEKILRIGLHSFVLAVGNIGCILIGFRTNKLLHNHEIAIQAPISGLLCIFAFLVWSVFSQRLPSKKLSLQGPGELVWVYFAALFWNPLIFYPLHFMRWHYQASFGDILSIWLFQLLVNFLALLFVNTFVHSGNEIIERRLKLSVKRPQIQLSNIILALASGLFTVVLVEFTLQLFYEPPTIMSGWRAPAPEIEKNQLGFRGQPIKYSDDDVVIVLLGDSQVEANACAYGWMPERRIQHYLNSFGKNVKVFTLGTSGYGQDQQLLILQEYYQKYRADFVILWQTPGNDIWNNMFPTHWPTNGTPKPTFWLENGELRGPSEQIGEEIKRSRFKLLTLWKRVFVPLNRDGEWEKYFPPPYAPLTNYTGPVNNQWQELWDQDLSQLRNENLDIEKSTMAIALNPPSKRMEYGITLTRKLLQRIDDLVTSHNGEFVIFRTKKSSDDIEVDNNVFVLNGKHYKYLKKQREENMKKVNRGFRSYVIPIQVENWMVGPQDAHLNEHAVDQVMQDLANSLKDLVPPSDNTREHE